MSNETIGMRLQLMPGIAGHLFERGTPKTSTPTEKTRLSQARWTCLAWAAASFVSFVSLSAAAVAASTESSADRGLALATQWCNSCHVVQQNDPGMDDGETGPPFATLTKYTPQMLKKLLAAGHADMDALSKLNDDDLAAIAAHLHRLKPEQRTR